MDELNLAAARSGLARAAIMVHIYRLANGSFPKSLDDVRVYWPSADLRDQCDPRGGGGPLKVLQAPKGLILYSVGTDRLDNGGGSGDETFIVTVPAQPAPASGE
jgi:hypothetical protein